MREQLVVARRLPAQRLTERIGIDRDQEQPGLSEEMFSRGFGNLRGCGEMDVAVPVIVGAAAIDALPLRLTPGRGRADFVDHAQASDSCLSLSPLGFSPGVPGSRADRIGGPRRLQAPARYLAVQNCRKPPIAPIIPTSVG